MNLTNEGAGGQYKKRGQEGGSPSPAPFTKWNKHCTCITIVLKLVYSGLNEADWKKTECEHTICVLPVIGQVCHGKANCQDRGRAYL